MRIVTVALGTRGDVQPMIALSKGLQAAGHAVTLVAGENFGAWAGSHGLPFFGTMDMEALMKSAQGVAWVESPRPRQQLGQMKRLLHQYGAQMYAPIVEQARDADLLIGGFVSSPFVQAASEKFGIPQINAPLQPYLPTRSGAASLAPIFKRRKSLLNLWIGQFMQRVIWSVAAETTNQLRATLGLPAHTAKSYTSASQRTPTINGFSRYVVPPPGDWGAHVRSAGYWFLDEQQGWQPPDDLVRFLEAGSPPIYVGFGSMTGSSPQQTVGLICAALQQAGLRGIIASGWSGAREAKLPDYAFAIESAPHDWLFPRVAGVVHHGGAGTTAAGLRAGTPSLILPHFSDQPYWARRVYELGAGAKPIPRGRVTVEKLAAGMRTLMTNAGIKTAAAQLGENIRAEQGIANAILLVEQMSKAG